MRTTLTTLAVVLVVMIGYCLAVAVGADAGGRALVTVVSMLPAMVMGWWIWDGMDPDRDLEDDPT